MMRGVVGLKILVEDIQSKYKLCQNKTEADFTNAVTQLEKSKHPGDNRIVYEMKKIKK